MERMDNAAIIQQFNKLSQQLGILHEYVELKFGADYKDFHKFKLSHPNVGFVVIPNEVEEDEQVEEEQHNNAVEQDFEERGGSGGGNGGGFEWDNNIIVSNVIQLDQDDEEEEERQFVPQLWGHQMQEDDDDNDKRHDFVTNGHNSVDFFVEEEEESCDVNGDSAILDFFNTEQKLINPLHPPSPSTRPPTAGYRKPRLVPRRRILKGNVNAATTAATPRRRKVGMGMGRRQKKKVDMLSAAMTPGSFLLPNGKPMSGVAVSEADIADPHRHSQFGIEYVNSDRGIRMILDGYTFRVNKYNKDSGRRYWVCQTTTCPTRIAQEVDGRPAHGLNRKPHNHHPPISSPPILKAETSS